MSDMSSGSKMRSFRKTLSGLPEAISTMRPSGSKPSEALYIQRAPGWNSRGSEAQAFAFQHGDLEAKCPDCSYSR